MRGWLVQPDGTFVPFLKTGNRLAGGRTRTTLLVGELCPYASDNDIECYSENAVLYSRPSLASQATSGPLAFLEWPR